MARRFYTSDTWRLARHVAELLATVLLLGGRCVYGAWDLRNGVGLVTPPKTNMEPENAPLDLQITNFFGVPC